MSDRRYRIMQDALEENERQNNILREELTEYERQQYMWLTLEEKDRLGIGNGDVFFSSPVAWPRG